MSEEGDTPPKRNKISDARLEASGYSPDKYNPMWDQEKDILKNIILVGYLTGKLSIFDIHYLTKVNKKLSSIGKEQGKKSIWFVIFKSHAHGVYPQETEPEKLYLGNVYPVDYRKLVIAIAASRLGDNVWLKFRSGGFVDVQTDGQLNLYYENTTPIQKRDQLRDKMTETIFNLFRSRTEKTGPDSYYVRVDFKNKLSAGRIYFFYMLLVNNFYIGSWDQMGSEKNLVYLDEERGYLQSLTTDVPDLFINKCINCDLKPKKRCFRCKDALYCSKECQKEHWVNGHRNECQ